MKRLFTDELLEAIVRFVIVSMVFMVVVVTLVDATVFTDPVMKNRCDEKHGVMAKTSNGLACVDVIFYKVKL